MFSTRIRSFVGNYFRRSPKQPQETDDPKKDKEVVEKKVGNMQYTSSLKYKDDGNHYALIDWLDQNTVGQVKCDIFYVDPQTFVPTYILKFENEDDALFCKIKFPPNGI